jgi:hypothetical protein
MNPAHCRALAIQDQVHAALAERWEDILRISRGGLTDADGPLIHLVFAAALGDLCMRAAADPEDGET